MTVRLWILGAADPEMAAIEKLLIECGGPVAYAVGPDGNRVHPGNAYRAIGYEVGGAFGDARSHGIVYLVECEVHRRGFGDGAKLVTIDHHRPGDPGYGRPPAEFFPASSIGQVISRLGSLGRLPADWPVGDGRYYGAGGCLRLDSQGWVVDDEAGGAPRLIPQRYVYVAAADHCLGAAYRGECPGVHPDDLMRWRAESRAEFQGRAVSDVLADVERAREALRAAPTLTLAPGLDTRDMRGRHVPELPEASAREGVCFVADGQPSPDGRIKVVCQSGSPEQIAAFIERWAPAHGLTDIYGDPARGFAGGYLS